MLNPTHPVTLEWTRMTWWCPELRASLAPGRRPGSLMSTAMASRTVRRRRQELQSEAVTPTPGSRGQSGQGGCSAQKSRTTTSRMIRSSTNPSPSRQVEIFSLLVKNRTADI